MPSGVHCGLMGFTVMSVRERSVRVSKRVAGAGQLGSDLLAATAAIKRAGLESGTWIALPSPQQRSLVVLGPTRAITTLRATSTVPVSLSPPPVIAVRRDFANE